MNYKKATEIFPVELLEQIQMYVEGCMIYIPKKRSNYSSWGKNSGAKEEYKNRNIKIKQEFNSGITIDQLSNNYGLSIESIKRIVYSK